MQVVNHWGTLLEEARVLLVSPKAAFQYAMSVSTSTDMTSELAIWRVPSSPGTTLIWTGMVLPFSDAAAARQYCSQTKPREQLQATEPGTILSGGRNTALGVRQAMKHFSIFL